MNDFETITSRAFHLVDDRGNLKAVLDQIDPAETLPSLRLLDNQGSTAIALQLNPGGEPVLSLSQENKLRIGVGVRPEHAGISLMDNEGWPVVWAEIHGEEKRRIVLYHAHESQGWPAITLQSTPAGEAVVLHGPGPDGKPVLTATFAIRNGAVTVRDAGGAVVWQSGNEADAAEGPERAV